jgi:LysR family glycine cleavage system transcriptional activator
VSTFASFASLWLIPRLAEFAKMHPQTDVICAASDRMVDLDADGFDIALRCTDRDLAAEGHVSLFSEVTIPVCSPAFAAAHAPLSDPKELAQHTLLGPVEEIERRFPWMGWAHWFAVTELAPMRGRSALRFSNHDQAVQAALAGQGVALARGALIVDQLAAGLLIPLFAGRYPTAHRYWLVTTSLARERPAVMDFISWVKQQARRTRQQMAQLGLSID